MIWSKIMEKIFSEKLNGLGLKQSNQNWNNLGVLILIFPSHVANSQAESVISLDLC